MKKTILYTDGACRGNPGPASYGYCLVEEDETIFEEGKTIGVTTNNVAEYKAVVVGLAKALELKCDPLELRSDSQLLIRQLLGQYKVKSPGLKPLFEEAKGLLKQFKSVQLKHIPREENERADELANEALDG